MFKLKLLLLLLLMVCESCAKTALLEAIFWELKPFIFRTSDGRFDGIFPKIFSEGEYYCGDRNSTLILFKKLLPTRKKYLSLLRSQDQYGKNELLDITQEKAVWFPDDSFALAQNDHVKDKGLQPFEIMKSKGLAVIMPRYMISLPNKMLHGIYCCRQIVVLTLMLALLFGIVMWVAECTYNNKFSLFFLKGAGRGLWWSLVSMTTVGYGDVVPRSIPGRVIASVWLLIGVVSACVMAATVTEVVNGLDGLDIYKKKVSVLENSYELKAAKENYAADTIPVESYEEALEMVRNGKVFAALINVDVAAWLQKEINDDKHEVPLRVVYVIPATIQINYLISMNLSASANATINCMNKQKDEVYSRSTEHFRRFCYTETLYVDSITDMFQKSVIYQLLLGFLVVIVCFGLLFEFWMRRKSKNDAKNCEDL